MVEFGVTVVVVIATVALLVGMVGSRQSEETRQKQRLLMAFDGWKARPSGRRRAVWFGYEALLAAAMIVAGLLMVLIIQG